MYMIMHLITSHIPGRVNQWLPDALWSVQIIASINMHVFYSENPIFPNLNLNNYVYILNNTNL